MAHLSQLKEVRERIIMQLRRLKTLNLSILPNTKFTKVNMKNGTSISNQRLKPHNLIWYTYCITLSFKLMQKNSYEVIFTDKCKANIRVVCEIKVRESISYWRLYWFDQWNNIFLYQSISVYSFRFIVIFYIYKCVCVCIIINIKVYHKTLPQFRTNYL